jgi:hypothetical protein
MAPGVVRGTAKAVRSKGSIEVGHEHFGDDVDPMDMVIVAGLYVRRLRDHLLAGMLTQEGFRDMLETNGRTSALVL